MKKTLKTLIAITVLSQTAFATTKDQEQVCAKVGATSFTKNYLSELKAEGLDFIARTTVQQQTIEALITKIKENSCTLVQTIKDFDKTLTIKTREDMLLQIVVGLEAYIVKKERENSTKIHTLLHSILKSYEQKKKIEKDLHPSLMTTEIYLNLSPVLRVYISFCNNTNQSSPNLPLLEKLKLYKRPHYLQ